MQPAIRWILLLVVAILILTPLLGRGLVVLSFPAPYEPNRVPFPYDPNGIVGTLLGTVTHRAGVPGTIKCSYEDPDADPVVVALARSPAGMRIVNDPNTLSYTLVWRPDVPGVYPVVVSAVDSPPSGDPNTVTGTILWNVLPANREPQLFPVDNISLLR